MNKRYRFFLIAGTALLLWAACGSSPSGETAGGDTGPGGARTAMERTLAEYDAADGQTVNPNFTGDGGKGMSLAILVPQGQGLTADQNYLPALVQGQFVTDFNTYSRIAVLDRQNLDKILEENESGYYVEGSNMAELGKIIPADYYLTGNITRTSSGYAMQIQITDKSSGISRASYSGNCTIAEFDNFTGIHRASAKLLADMGIALSEKARRELAGASSTRQVDSQTALAQGITAQRQGSEAGALTYYYQAAMYDPSLLEAASRVSVLAANVSSGSIGDDARNAVQWRKDWQTRLTEADRFFANYIANTPPPCEIVYSTDMEKGKIDYDAETMPFTFLVRLFTSQAYYAALEKAVQDITNGLEATKMNGDWRLRWPGNFANSYKTVAYDVDFELINSGGAVIGARKARLGFSWGISGGTKIEVSRPSPGTERVTINAKVEGITGTLTIRVRAVNGKAPQQANVRINAINERPPADNLYQFDHFTGELSGITGIEKLPKNIVIKENGERVLISGSIIPASIWGTPVTSISKELQRQWEIGSVIWEGHPPDAITERFVYRGGTVTIPDTVKRIGGGAIGLGTDQITMKKKDGKDVSFRTTTSGFAITIGADVILEQNSFYATVTKVRDGRGIRLILEKPTGLAALNALLNFNSSADGHYMNFSGSAGDLFGFTDFYNKNGKKAGTYKFTRISYEFLLTNDYQWFYEAR